MGGGLRVPKIQQYIQESLNGMKVNQKLNQDEAATFGAGFLAASLSTSFKVRPIHIARQAPFDISIKVSKENESEVVVYSATLMKRHEEFQESLIVNLTTESDLRIELFENFEGDQRIVNTIKLQSANDTQRNLTLEFILNKHGIIEFYKAHAVVPTIVQRNVTQNTTFEIIEEIVNAIIPLNFTVQYPQRMTSEELFESLNNLDALDAQEARIRTRAQAKNYYESLIYTSRDWLKDDVNQKYIIPEDKATLLELLETVYFLCYKIIGGDHALQ
eukprot:TRINITY_DN105117_c0_g1_i1.p4 TRINITY_DN105117_c0_g1~~TRINITY_DN105117_c0_g1_i1.p4  ORF type:complete len:274 (-),score=18.43 TRINITY_DN105117_c0_g1_i1:594-1415(-)